jgi:hypothetical protein
MKTCVACHPDNPDNLNLLYTTRQRCWKRSLGFLSHPGPNTVVQLPNPLIEVQDWSVALHGSRLGFVFGEHRPKQLLLAISFKVQNTYGSAVHAAHVSILPHKSWNLKVRAVRLGVLYPIRLLLKTMAILCDRVLQATAPFIRSSRIVEMTAERSHQELENVEH